MFKELTESEIDKAIHAAMERVYQAGVAAGKAKWEGIIFTEAEDRQAVARAAHVNALRQVYGWIQGEAAGTPALSPYHLITTLSTEIARLEKEAAK